MFDLPRELRPRRRAPSTRWASTFALTLAMLFCAAPASAQEADRDPWFGPDKTLHFGVSAALAVGGYTAAGLRWETAPPKLAFGAAVALSAGILKELLDLAHYGTPSYRDLVWDAAGTVVGLALAWTVDHLFFGPRPLFGEGPSRTAWVRPGGGLSLTVRFP